MNQPQNIDSAVIIEKLARRRRSLQVAKILTYFVLLCVAVTILKQIFKEIAGTNYFIELSRLSGLSAANLDTSKNIDDFIVTFFALTITFLLILPVAWVHIITKGNETDPALTQTLIVLSIIVAGVMLLLEDNLARSFSLVGVVAAVRYRNTIKDPKDAVYLFLSLGIGMACGLQAYHVALFLSLFDCGILLVLWAYQTGAKQVGEADLLQTLKASEKKGERTPAEALAWLSLAGRARLEAGLRTQSKYILLASTFAKTGKKKLNAVITIETLTGSDSARDALNATLQDDAGKWRLIGSELRDGVNVIEYLGRLPRRRTPPLNLLKRLRSQHPDVSGVSFRSLRKMLGDKHEVSGPALTPQPPNAPAANSAVAHWFEPEEHASAPAARTSNQT